MQGFYHQPYLQEQGLSKSGYTCLIWGLQDIISMATLFTTLVSRPHDSLSKP